MYGCVLGEKVCVTGYPPMPGRSHVCHPCLDRYARSIDALSAGYRALGRELIVTNQRAEDEHRSPGKPGSRPPVAFHVRNLRDEIVCKTTEWEAALHHWLSMGPPTYRGLRHELLVSRASQFLADHVEALSTLPRTLGYFRGADHAAVSWTGHAALVDLALLHDRVKRICGAVEAAVRLPGECPTCGAWTLRRLAGEDQVWCDMCQMTWGYTDYQAWTNAYLHAHASTSLRDRPHSTA